MKISKIKDSKENNECDAINSIDFTEHYTIITRDNVCKIEKNFLEWHL